MEGIVKWFNNKKGFGFVTGDDNEEYFVHYSAIPQGTFLRDNDKISFDPAETDKGKQAQNVELLQKGSERMQEQPAEETSEENTEEEQPVEEESKEEEVQEEPVVEDAAEETSEENTEEEAEKVEEEPEAETQEETTKEEPEEESTEE